MSARVRLVLSLRFLRRLLVGAVVCYVAVSLCLGGTPRARPVFQALALSWLLVLAIWWYRCLKYPKTEMGGRGVRALELVVSNAALALLLAEVCLRAFAAWAGSSLLLGATLDDHRLQPGRDYGAGLLGNRRGYPGPDVAPTKPPGVYRIAALGDSFAVGPAVPFADNYLTRLQRILPGAEVCNFGVSGAGPREYLAVLRRDAWKVRPDQVLVSVFVGNDITETLPAPRALDPRGHAVYLLCERGWRLARENARREREPTAPQRLAAPPLSEATYREVEARRLAVCLGPPSAALEKKWQRALGYLDALVAECRRREVEVAFVLIPDEFQVNPAVLAQALRDVRANRAALDLDLPQRRLRDFCAGRGVPCLDLLDAFRGLPDTYAPCDTHWNVRGNRLAAERIAEWLRERVTRPR